MSSLFVIVPVQPVYEDASAPDYAGTFMGRAEREEVARQVSRGDRALAICLDHADLTNPRDLVPPDKQLGYWRDGWVDRDGNLWMLGELDLGLDSVRRIHKTMQDGSLKWGASIYTRHVKESETARIIAIDPTHVGITTNPNLGALGIGSWISRAGTDPAAMARTLHERHFGPEQASYVPEETRARWGDGSRPPSWKWPLKKPLKDVLKRGRGDSQSKPADPFERGQTSESATKATADATPPPPPPPTLLSFLSFARPSSMAETPAPAAGLPVPVAAPPPAAALTPPSSTTTVSGAEENRRFITEVDALLGGDGSLTMDPLATRVTAAQLLLGDRARRQRMDLWDAETGRAAMESVEKLQKFFTQHEKQVSEGLERLVSQGRMPRGHAHEILALRTLDNPASRIVNEMVVAATDEGVKAQLEREKLLIEEQKLRKEFAEKEQALQAKNKAMEEEISTLKRGREAIEEEARSHKRRYEELASIKTSDAVTKGVEVATQAGASSTADLLRVTTSSARAPQGAALSEAFMKAVAPRLGSVTGGHVLPAYFKQGAPAKRAMTRARTRSTTTRKCRAKSRERSSSRHVNI